MAALKTGNAYFSLISWFLNIAEISLFVFGRPYYVINPPSGSVIQKMISCIGYALAQRRVTNNADKDHWLDYAEDKYDRIKAINCYVNVTHIYDSLGLTELIADWLMTTCFISMVMFRNEIRSVLHLLLMFIPLPMFYALFDQQGSSWTLQCTKMDLMITERWALLPDQMQAFNSLLVVIFIPLFEFLIYPLAEKNHQNLRPLRRMAVGLSLAAMSFVIAGVLQIAIEWTLVDLPMPSTSTSRVQVINSSPCPVDISGHFESSRLDVSQVANASIKASGRHKVTALATCSKHRPAIKPLQSVLQLQPVKSYFYLIAEHGETLNGMLVEFPSEKSKLGGSFLCFVVVGTGAADKFVISLKRNGYDVLQFKTATFSVPDCHHVDPGRLFFNGNQFSPTNGQTYRYNLYVTVNDTPAAMKLNDMTYIGSGAVHAIVLRPVAPSSQSKALDHAIQLQFDVYTLIRRNVISVLYQIPQYVVLTVGEILFSITGLAFAYSQAPESMKSVIQAAWLLACAVGNLIDVIVTGINFLNQVAEFFLFAVLMIMATTVFSILAYNYSQLVNDGSQASVTLPSNKSASQTSKSSGRN